MSLLLAGGASPPVVAPFIPNVGQDGARAPQRGFVGIAANLLLTTLAVVAAAPFIPQIHQSPAPVARILQQAPTGYNLSIYAPPVVAAPFIPVTYPNPVAKPTVRELPIARNFALFDNKPFIQPVYANVAARRAAQDISSANLLLGTLLPPPPFIPQVSQGVPAARYTQQTHVASNALPLSARPFISEPPQSPSAAKYQQEIRPSQNVLPLESKPFIPALFDQIVFKQYQKQGVDYTNLLLGTLAPVIPVPPTVEGGGGGGPGYNYPRTYWERKRNGRDYSGPAINDILDKAASEVYALLAKNKAVQAKAVEIIRPFTHSNAKKPQVASIDWRAVESDARAVEALINLWSDEVAGMQEEEDIFAILLLES